MSVISFDVTQPKQNASIRLYSPEGSLRCYSALESFAINLGTLSLPLKQQLELQQIRDGSSTSASAGTPTVTSTCVTGTNASMTYNCLPLLLERANCVYLTQSLADILSIHMTGIPDGASAAIVTFDKTVYYRIISYINSRIYRHPTVASFWEKWS